MASSSPYTRFRNNRMKLFQNFVIKNRFKDDTVNILDIGGNIRYWIPYIKYFNFPIKIDILNISFNAEDNPYPDIISTIIGDACNLEFLSNEQYDFVHSNSVIEHVG